jgi:hypothetical protein
MFSMTRLAKPLLILLSATLFLEGCAVANDKQCFTARPSVIRPDERIALANLNTGASGRALAEAVFEGDLDLVRQLVSADPKLLSTQVTFDKKMQSAPPGQYGDLLAFAVSRCNGDMATLLLELGMPADGVQRGEALALALLSDSPDIAEMLLNNGASPDPQKTGGKNVMYELIAFGATGGVQTLLRHKADMQYVDSFGNDHLDTALSMEQFAIAEHLVKGGAHMWRINGAGALSAWTLTKPPVLEPSRDDIAARERLITAAKSGAPTWPAPDPLTVRQMVLAKTWPTPEMQSAGMVLSKEAKADIESRFGETRQ